MILYLALFQGYCRFCAHDPTPILQFHPNFWGVPVFPFDQIAYVGVSPSRNFKLISREIIFEVLQVTTCVKNIPERHRPTDGQTDGRLTVA